LKGQSNETKQRLERFKDLYSAALVASEAARDRMQMNMNQYLGSDEIDGSTERASIVRNITFEVIESEVGAEIPIPKVDAGLYSQRRDENARAVERLTSAIRSRLPFEELNDRDERYTYVLGGSIFYVEWDALDRVNGEGGVKVHLISPMNFIPQPSITDVSDMDYCFIRFITTRGELLSKYGVSEDEVSLAECEYLSDLEDSSGDAVALVVTFYKDECGRVGKFVFSGDLPLLDIPNYYKRKRVVCKKCGESIDDCKCESPDPETVDLDTETVTQGDGRTVEIPYYVPEDFPIIIRKNTIGDDGLFGCSDCERIRPQQQAINKVESRIIQKLLRAGVTPIIPEGTAIVPTNTVFGQVIRTRPGESVDSFGKIDTTPEIKQDILEADRLYDQAKRVLGISDALQGLDATTSESGYARQLKIARSSSRLETKKRMKQLAYCRLYELIFRHYLAFSDGPRRLSYRDSLGQVSFSEFNRYDFIEQDKRGNYYYDDSYLFSVEIQPETEFQSESLWETNLTNLERGTLGDKTSYHTLLRYWQLQDKANFPNARENVEYFRDLIKKENEKNNESEKTNEKEG
jgi:hypothetical protein